MKWWALGSVRVWIFFLLCFKTVWERCWQLRARGLMADGRQIHRHTTQTELEYGGHWEKSKGERRERERERVTQRETERQQSASSEKCQKTKSRSRFYLSPNKWTSVSVYRGRALLVMRRGVTHCAKFPRGSAKVCLDNNTLHICLLAFWFHDIAQTSLELKKEGANTLLLLVGFTNGYNLVGNIWKIRHKLM